MNQAVTFYVIDYKKWKNNYLALEKKGGSEYETWFFQNAEKYKFPDKVYTRVIINHPVVSTSIIYEATNVNGHIFSTRDSVNVVYYVLNPGATLIHFKGGFYRKYESSELEIYKKFLEDIQNEKIYVVVEYNKKLGWVNYDEMMSKLNSLAQNKK